MPANKAELLKRVITCTTSDMRRLAAKAIKKAKEKESFFGLLFDWQLDKTHVWAKPQFQRELFQGLMSASPEAITIFDALFTQFYTEAETGEALKAVSIQTLPVTDEALEAILKAFLANRARLSSQVVAVLSFGLVWAKYLNFVKRTSPKGLAMEASLDELLERTAEYLETHYDRLQSPVSSLRGALQLSQPANEVSESSSTDAAPEAPSASTAAEGSRPSHDTPSVMAQKGAKKTLVAEAIKAWQTPSETPPMNEALVADPVDTPTVPEPIQPTETAPVDEPDTLQSTVNVLTNVPAKTAKPTDSGRKKKSSGNTTLDGEALTQCLDASPIATVPPVAEGFTRTLGYAVRYGSFVNCYGVAQWDRAKATFVPANFVALFPSFGAVNLKVISPNQIPNGSLWVIDWCSYDLQPYQDGAGEVRKDYVYQLDFVQLKAEGRVHSFDSVGGYPVVYPLEAEVDFKKSVYVDFAPLEGRPKAFQEERSPLASLPVLLRVNDRYFGPFPLREDGLNRCYVNVPLVMKDGVLSGFKDTDPSCVFRGTLQTWNDTAQPAFHDVDFFLAAKAPHYRFDTLSEEELIRRFHQERTEKQNRSSSRAENLREIATILGGEVCFGEQRRDRVMHWANRYKARLTDYSNAMELIYSLIWSRKDRYLPEVATLLTRNPEAMEQLLTYKGIKERFETMQKAISELETRKTQTEKALAQTSNAIREEAQRANQDLLNENQALMGKNEALRESLALLDSTVDLHQLRTSLQNEVTGLQAKQTELTQQVERIESHLAHAFQNPQEYAFDGAIASKLISAASAWEAGVANQCSHERAQAVKSAHVLGYKGERLAEYLVEKVQSYRGYDDNTVLNFFLLLTQSFLTIFSGAPGVGKTSLCEILGHVLGLDHFGRSLPNASQALWNSPWAASRFLPVSVERGWTSKRDFVGYYNPLSHSFESIDPRRREAFAQLDAEKRAGVNTVPFLILLDEANLSPMEYYWGDFMRIADSRAGTSSYIALGGDAQYFIPDTLRFVATINNDFTTENLSPRLLDRASIVTLPEQTSGVVGMIDEEEVLPPVSWEAMYHYFGPERSLAHRTKIEPLLERIYAHAMAIGVPVSMRTRLAILHYISAANSVFKHVDQPGFMTGIDFCVMQRLLPRINGNGEAYREKISAFEALLANEGLLGSAQLLREVMAKGDNAMDWYRFF